VHASERNGSGSPAFVSCDFIGWRLARGWFATARTGSAGGVTNGEVAGPVGKAPPSAPADFGSPAAASPPRKPASAGATRPLETLLAAGG